jgi:hypothetical protein
MSLRHFAPGALSASIFLTSQNPFARIIYLLVSLVPLVLASGLILQSLWGWFITPLWPKPISYAEAVGIVLVAKFIRGMSITAPAPDAPRDLWSLLERSFLQIVAMTLFWGLAAIFHAALF